MHVCKSFDVLAPLRGDVGAVEVVGPVEVVPTGPNDVVVDSVGTVRVTVVPVTVRQV